MTYRGLSIGLFMKNQSIVRGSLYSHAGVCRCSTASAAQVNFLNKKALSSVRGIQAR